MNKEMPDMGSPKTPEEEKVKTNEFWERINKESKFLLDRFQGAITSEELNHLLHQIYERSSIALRNPIYSLEEVLKGDHRVLVDAKEPSGAMHEKKWSGVEKLEDGNIRVSIPWESAQGRLTIKWAVDQEARDTVNKMLDFLKQEAENNSK